MTNTVVTLGELMMRLSPAGKLRLRQAQGLEVRHGGAEANVAVSLAEFGLKSRFVTALPSGELGTQALQFLRAHNVETDRILRRPGRLGLYFMEDGADYRSGCVMYDRSGSVFTTMTPEDVEWDEVFQGADWFHISGITPALCTSTKVLAEVAIGEARRRGVRISIDLNYRESLWAYGVSASSVLPAMVAKADTLIAGRGDCFVCLGLEGDGENGSDEWAISLSEKVLTGYPNLERFSLTIRASASAEEHGWRAFLSTRSTRVFSRFYRMKHVVDRVGTGDAFCAGLIYAVLKKKAPQEAINFGAAANCLKHTIPGDVNEVTLEEVLSLADANTFGRLRR